jgi:hypothetical protein
MKAILTVIAILPFVAGVASAADLLNDEQLDRVVAGDIPNIYCPTCIVASSSSVSVNGITVNTSMTMQPTTGGADGGTNAGGGSTGTGDMSGTGGAGGTGDTGGTGGTGDDGSGSGDTGGSNGTVIGGGGGSNSPGPVVVSPPASFVANLVHYAGFNPVSP